MKTLLLKLSCVSAFLLASSSAVLQATTLLDEKFTYANGTNITATSQNLPTSARWYTARTTADTNVNSGTLQVTNMGGGTNGVLAFLTNTPGQYVSLAVGDTLSLSFDYSFTTNRNEDWSFVFGLYATPGTAATRTNVENTTFNNSAFLNWTGYVAKSTFANVASDRFGIAERTSAANNLMNAASYSIFGAQEQPSTHGALNTTYNASFSITRLDATTVELISNINGQTLTRTDTTGIFTNFDAIVIGANRDVGTFTLDNVNVALIPEPSTFALVLLSGVAGLLALRRKKG